MKFKSILTLLLTIGLLAGCMKEARAQTASSLLNNIPPIIGTPVTYQGQTFLVSTNASGGLQVYTYGVNGTNVVTVPATADQAFEVANAWIRANNPANITYYGSNEITARIGGGYLQNSGQAVAVIALDKYGTFGWSNVGFGAGVLQGNNAGKSGTAGAYGEAVYRRPIGDVAAIAGVGGGWDNWNGKPFVMLKAGLEYRQNAHLGEFLDAIYAYEGNEEDRGLIIMAGVTYAFDK